MEPSFVFAPVIQRRRRETGALAEQKRNEVEEGNG